MKTSHWLKVTMLCAAGLLAAVAACSGRHLPPGTPPPEYEPPIVPPWTPESGDAGVPQAAERAAEPAGAPEAGAQLSLDAGPR